MFTCTSGAPVHACEWYRSRFWQSTRAPPPGAADSRNASSGSAAALQMRGKRFRAVLIDSAVSEHLRRHHVLSRGSRWALTELICNTLRAYDTQCRSDETSVC